MNLTFTTYHFSPGNSKLWAAFIFLLIWLASCNNNQANSNKLVVTKEDSLAEVQKIRRAYAQIATVKPTIHSGDLITRTGTDFTSESLRGLNQRDQTYSHCGIASIENDSLFVYHALGGDFNPDQKILRQPIEIFGQPGDNRGIGIFRFQISRPQTDSILDMAKKLFKEGTMFDMEFDLKSDNRMYCAEYIYKSFLWGSLNKLQFSISHIKDFAFVGVDDLFLHPSCHQLQRIVYK